jgi:hypothetical protein
MTAMAGVEQNRALIRVAGGLCRIGNCAVSKHIQADHRQGRSKLHTESPLHLFAGVVGERIRQGAQW